MTSIGSRFNQLDNQSGYFIPVGSCVNKVFAYNATAGAVPFSSAQWAGNGSLAVSKYASSINAAGAGLLRDLGKTIVSSGRTFRKVQLVVSTSGLSTFGVGGVQGSTPYVEDYLTGYIELGIPGDGAAATAPVAKYGR